MDNLVATMQIAGTLFQLTIIGCVGIYTLKCYSCYRERVALQKAKDSVLLKIKAQ